MNVVVGRRSRCCSSSATRTKPERRDRGTVADGARQRGRCTSRSRFSGLTALGAEVVWTRMLSLHFGAHGLHLLADPRGVSDRARHRQHRRLRDGARPPSARAWRSDGVSCCCARAMAWAAYMLTAVAAVLADQSVDRDDAVVHVAARSRPLHVGRAARRDPLGRELPAGAGRRSRRRSRIRRGWSAASTRRTQSARSSARSASSFVLVPWIGSQHPQQVLIIVAALSALLMLEPSYAGAGAKASAAPAIAGTLRARASRWWRPVCSRAACTRCPACWSPTAATPRRASARPTSSTSAKG